MTIRILGPNDPALNALRKSIETHPEIDVELTIIAWEDYRAELDKTLGAYDYDAVFIPGHIWMPQLVEDGLLRELDPIIAKSTTDLLVRYDSTDIFPTIQKECAYARVESDPKQYMLPLFTDGHILFYRSDLIQMPDEISPSKIAEILSNFKLPSGMKPFAQKAHSSEIFLDFLPYFWDFGASLYVDGTAEFNSKLAAKALAYYRDLQSFSPVNTETYGNGEIVNAITSGMCAAVISWGGQAAAIFSDLDAGPTARIQTASVKNAWNATWGVSLPSNLAENRATSVLEQLMLLMGLDCDQFVTEIAGSPVRKKSYLASALEKYPWLGSQKKLLENCRNLPTDPAFGKYLGILYAETHNAFTGKKSPEQALSDAFTGKK